MSIESKFNAEDLADYRAMFAKFDADGNGSIDHKELRDVLIACGEKDVPGYRVREMIEQADLNRDGVIDWLEFLTMLDQLRQGRETGFSTVVSRVGNLNVHEGTSSASADGTTHSYSDEEKVAFVDWINYVLGENAECNKYMPVRDAGLDLFNKCTDGIILMKLINDAVPETIDERAINKKATHPVQIAENLTLMLNSARAIGCNVVNIGPSDIKAATPHLLLGLIWQIIRIGLFARINLTNVPGLARLLEGDETLEDLMALPAEQLLLRWFNYHLAAANHPRRVGNFGHDIKDSENYTILLNQIAPPGSGVDKSALGLSGDPTRAERMLEQADKIGCRKFVRANDVAKGNQKLNLAFVANLFNMFPALEAVEIEVIEETREEKTYRNWMNSLGVEPFVNNLYQDLRDGLVLIQLFDKIRPGIVHWDKVNQPPFSKIGGNMKKLENCNYAVDLAKQTNMSVVGIGGKDIFDGNKTLSLAVVWQMMRAHTLTILNQLAGGQGLIQDKEIIQWVNQTLAAAGKTTKLDSFRDSSISSSLVVIDLVDAIKPQSIQYNLVISNPVSLADKMKNAKYAVSMARKIGATVFALPEDLVEVKQKMVMTVFATIMVVGYTPSN
ncbi:hypothetical protein H696_01058 [Fonticula alba]|uniref:Fimbrin n=1 Tax=Fonticula alba TaxID=691883 RepID=A0A058ZCH3_FONAL|nr:hypothetical protein H696_01058 [Fonticula alba]KCV71641.1 hypothetical protein H696_01058 [Fonticula alba]|eukprot:XP_009493219.1 hypothetical protein H696_01058 [Fonticula alba]